MSTPAEYLTDRATQAGEEAAAFRQFADDMRGRLTDFKDPAYDALTTVARYCDLSAEQLEDVRERFLQYAAGTA
jgi:phage-related minor tail protein